MVIAEDRLLLQSRWIGSISHKYPVDEDALKHRKGNLVAVAIVARLAADRDLRQRRFRHGQNGTLRVRFRRSRAPPKGCRTPHPRNGGQGSGRQVVLTLVADWLSIDRVIAFGIATVACQLTRAFGLAWIERSRRKTRIALEREHRQTRIALKRERKKGHRRQLDRLRPTPSSRTTRSRS